MTPTTTAPATITVNLLGVDARSGEPRMVLPADTLCVGVARFERRFAAAHGGSDGFPTDMDTAK